MTLPQDVLGVDIAKDWIETFCLSTGQRQRIATTKAALARFARAAKGALVVLEASGGYERPVTEALATAGTSYARVNPRQACEFARACGILAKPAWAGRWSWRPRPLPTPTGHGSPISSRGATIW